METVLIIAIIWAGALLAFRALFTAPYDDDAWMQNRRGRSPRR